MIHYELIGTIPSVECYRFDLDHLIKRYQHSKKNVTIPDFGIVTESERKDYIDLVFKDPAAIERMAMGVTIELCGQHFYGLKGEDFSDIAALIDAIQGMDDYVEFS